MEYFSVLTFPDLSYRITYGNDNKLVVLAAKMLGFDYFYGQSKPRRQLPKLSVEERLTWISFEDFKKMKIEV